MLPVVYSTRGITQSEGFGKRATRTLQIQIPLAGRADLLAGVDPD